MKICVLVSNGGDGSYGITYITQEACEWLGAYYEEHGSDYDSIGCDGDGFHYDVIDVPDGHDIGQDVQDVREVSLWFNY